MIEIVGDFDRGRDQLDGDQRQAVIDVVAAILDVRGLGTGDVFFHRDLGSPKTCPGDGVDKPVLLTEIRTGRVEVSARGAAEQERPGSSEGARQRAGCRASVQRRVRARS